MSMRFVYLFISSWNSLALRLTAVHHTVQTLSRVDDLVAACDDRQIGERVRVRSAILFIFVCRFHLFLLVILLQIISLNFCPGCINFDNVTFDSVDNFYSQFLTKFGGVCRSL